MKQNPDHSAYRLYHMLMNWKRATRDPRVAAPTGTHNHESEESHGPGTHGVLGLLLLRVTDTPNWHLLHGLVLNSLFSELVTSLRQISRLLPRYAQTPVSTGMILCVAYENEK